MGQINRGFQDTDDYDLIVDIDSISSKTSIGWRVEISNTIAYELQSRKDLTEEFALSAIRVSGSHPIVTVLGLFNRGKTHVLNHLAELKLPSDKKIHTKGLSFRVPANSGFNFVLLDTAGSNSPIVEGVDEEKMAIKRNTEMFIQDLAFSLADIILFVINELTWPDQEYLQALQRNMVKYPKKKLFVIHNFHDITDEKELLCSWRRWVLRTHRGKVIEHEIPSKGKAIVFQETAALVPTVHVFLAREDSPAGQLWNPITYDFLKTQLINAVPEKKILKDLIVEEVNSNLKKYVKRVDSVFIRWNQHWTRKKKDLSYISPSTKITKTPRQQTTRSYSNSAMSKVNRIPFEEWQITEEELILNEEAAFYLCVDGDLSLKAAKVKFDGFRIITHSPTDFEPQCDVVKSDEGLLVALEVSGMYLEDDGDGVGGGKIQEGVITDDTQAHLVIEGYKALIYPHYQRSQEGNWKVERLKRREDDNVVEHGEKKLRFEDKFKHLTENTFDEKQHPRKGGKFTISISVPPDIDENLKNAKIVIKNGLYTCFLPRKIQVTKKDVNRRNDY